MEAIGRRCCPSAGRPSTEGEFTFMDGSLTALEGHRLAEAVRNACVQAALQGYEQAAMDGLCHEGAFEAAVEAIRGLDIEAILAKLR